MKPKRGSFELPGYPVGEFPDPGSPDPGEGVAVECGQLRRGYASVGWAVNPRCSETRFVMGAIHAEAFGDGLRLAAADAASDRRAADCAPVARDRTRTPRPRPPSCPRPRSS